MKSPVSLLFTVLLLAGAPLWAQMQDDTGTESQRPVGSTLINSDELHSDQTTHTSDFIGKVVVDGQNFHMTCQEMKVFFTTDNKVSKIVATGDVVITQPNRVTHCGHAEYTQDNDTFVLTEEPVIYDGKTKVQGTRIIINRQTQQMQTDQGRTTVTIQNSDMNQATTTPSGTSTPEGPGANLPTK